MDMSVDVKIFTVPHAACLRFFLSLEDNLFRIFGGDKIKVCRWA
jgi:hypothetical protein